MKLQGMGGGGGGGDCLIQVPQSMYKNSLKIVLTLISDNFKNGLSF